MSDIIFKCTLVWFIVSIAVFLLYELLTTDRHQRSRHNETMIEWILATNAIFSIVVFACVIVIAASQAMVNK